MESFYRTEVGSLTSYTEALLWSAAVPADPLNTRLRFPMERGFTPFQLPGYCSTGAAGDGRAPTEERSCVRGRNFCLMGRTGSGFRLFTKVTTLSAEKDNRLTSKLVAAFTSNL